MNPKTNAKKHDLKSVAKRKLGIDLDKDHQTSDWSSKPLTDEMIEYAAQDSQVLTRLHDSLHRDVLNKDLSDTIELEHRTLPAMVWMSTAGVPFDSQGWSLALKSLEQDVKTATSELDTLHRELTGEPSTKRVNWNSSVQVKCAFKGLGITLKDTKEATLKQFAHPLAAKLLAYRKFSKLLNTYGQKLVDGSHEGRLYPSWKQIGTATGRMSCSSPNLQNFPPQVRKYVTAPGGRLLVKADYSQIELRIAATISKDKKMLDAFQNGVDIHQMTAKKLTGQTTVDEAARKLAKAVNFGLLYGQGARGLMEYAKSAYDIEMTPTDAESHRKTFFKTYPGIAKWHYAVKAAFQLGDRKAATLTGRTRSSMKSFNELLNHPVQGTGADGLKAAMSLLWERRAECPGAVPVLVVHDEIVVECDEENKKTATAWLTKAMTEGMEQILHLGGDAVGMPIRVDVETGRSWGGGS